MNNQRGMVIRGINNIYSVILCDEAGPLEPWQVITCRIKGKVLQGIDREYAPLAPGDIVNFIPVGTEEGMITGRKERRSRFTRWNAKRQENQTLSANIDLLVIVASADEPPLRPRFIDRAIVCTYDADILLILNKCDLPLTAEEDERFRLYSELGYQTLHISAFDEAGIELVRQSIAGKSAAFVGQSGVGKSTIINALTGSAEQQVTGDISLKYNRGRHTTNHSLAIRTADGVVIDTPGVREIHIPTTSAIHIVESFPEFKESYGKCEYDGCQHDHEPGCDVKRRVEEGRIHPDRYESYLRMLDSVQSRERQY